MEHLALLQSKHPLQIENPLWLPTKHSRTFADWLKQKVRLASLGLIKASK